MQNNSQCCINNKHQSELGANNPTALSLSIPIRANPLNVMRSSSLFSHSQERLSLSEYMYIGNKRGVVRNF